MKRAPPRRSSVAATALLAALVYAAACAPDGDRDAGVVDDDAGAAALDGGGGGDDGGSPVADDAGVGPVPSCSGAFVALFADATTYLQILTVDAQYDPSLDDSCAAAEDAVAVDITLSTEAFDPAGVAWTFDTEHAPRESIVAFRFGNGVRAVACAAGDDRDAVAVQLVLENGTVTAPACGDVDP